MRNGRLYRRPAALGRVVPSSRATNDLRRGDFAASGKNWQPIHPVGERRWGASVIAGLDRLAIEGALHLGRSPRRQPGRAPGDRDRAGPGPAVHRRSARRPDCGCRHCPASRAAGRRRDLPPRRPLPLEGPAHRDVGGRHPPDAARRAAPSLRSSRAGVRDRQRGDAVGRGGQRAAQDARGAAALGPAPSCCRRRPPTPAADGAQPVAGGLSGVGRASRSGPGEDRGRGFRRAVESFAAGRSAIHLLAQRTRCIVAPTGTIPATPARSRWRPRRWWRPTDRRPSAASGRRPGRSSRWPRTCCSRRRRARATSRRSASSRGWSQAPHREAGLGPAARPRRQSASDGGVVPTTPKPSRLLATSPLAVAYLN